MVFGEMVLVKSVFVWRVFFLRAAGPTCYPDAFVDGKKTFRSGAQHPPNA